VVKGLSKESMIGIRRRACGRPPRHAQCHRPAEHRRAGIPRGEASALREIKNTVVIANIFGLHREDYERTIEILNDARALRLRAEVSCPTRPGACIRQRSALLDEVSPPQARGPRRSSSSSHPTSRIAQMA